MTNQPLRCFECGSPIKKDDPYIYYADVDYTFVDGESGEPLGTAFFHLNCWVTPNDEPLRETASRLSLLLDLAAHGMRNLVEGYDPECVDVVMTDLQESWQRLQDARDRLAKHAGREQKAAGKQALVN